jgi:hypothetical protein
MSNDGHLFWRGIKINTRFHMKEHSTNVSDEFGISHFDSETHSRISTTNRLYDNTDTDGSRVIEGLRNGELARRTIDDGCHRNANGRCEEGKHDKVGVEHHGFLFKPRDLVFMVCKGFLRLNLRTGESEHRNFICISYMHNAIM